jgi:hypothetical protein
MALKFAQEIVEKNLLKPLRSLREFFLKFSREARQVRGDIIVIC